MIEQEERVEVGELPRSDAANQMDTRALNRRLGSNDLLDGSNRHA
jgi:hemin uptake protein HemP